RTIPIHYQVALHQYSLRFKLLSVTDGAGSERQVKQSRDGFSTKIRIGNPDVRVRGAQVYRITYEVYRAILHEQDRTVLRWNATGNEWGVPINQSTTTVVLPSALGDDAVVYDAWTGGYGATEKNYTSRRVDDRTIEFRTGRLPPREGITIEISMPDAAVAQAGFVRRLMWIMWDNIAYGAFLIVLAGCWIFWYKRGRDEQGMGSIVVQYDPPDGLGPAEIGTVIDETVNMHDISAAIVDMAVRGYIEIEDVSETKLLFFKDNDYQFRKKKSRSGLRPYEALLYDGIFGSEPTKKLSDLKFEFHETVSEVKREIYRSLTTNGYFDGNPTHWRQGFALAAFLISAGLFVAVGFFQYAVIGTVYIAPIVIGGILSLVTVMLFARIIPRKTRKGRIAWEKTKGLEEYLRRAEQQEIEKQERQGVFERLLPYAIALGLTDRWATAFEGIYTEPPNWYRGRYNDGFSTMYFVHSLNSSVHAMNSSLPAAPRSSGGSSGGFGGGGGGGGFGGGGGGAW
ncbi:MAG: DUF2207 domain-containing protein, partial [Gemmatimonadales bacterium]